MWVVCKICWHWCQWCGRKCKCWRWANLIWTMNSLYDLWMLAEELKAHQNDIYSKSKLYTPIELFDYYVNNVELPERVNKAVNNYNPTKSYESVKNFKPKRNPNPTCVFDDKNGVWSRCIYCNSVKLYAPKVCPSYWLNVDDNNLDNNQNNNEHS